jgi:hypothetical protein
MHIGVYHSCSGRSSWRIRGWRAQDLVTPLFDREIVIFGEGSTQDLDRERWYYTRRSPNSMYRCIAVNFFVELTESRDERGLVEKTSAVFSGPIYHYTRLWNCWWCYPSRKPQATLDTFDATLSSWKTRLLGSCHSSCMACIRKFVFAQYPSCM